MHSYTVTIGRNVGTTPLSDADWLASQGEVRHLLFDLRIGQTDSVEQHMGVGYWNGISEESAKITLLAEDKLPSFVIAHLSGGLAEIAKRYDQDAIALTVGISTLITP